MATSKDNNVEQSGARREVNDADCSEDSSEELIGLQPPLVREPKPSKKPNWKKSEDAYVMESFDNFKNSTDGSTDVNLWLIVFASCYKYALPEVRERFYTIVRDQKIDINLINRNKYRMEQGSEEETMSSIAVIAPVTPSKQIVTKKKPSSSKSASATPQVSVQTPQQKLLRSRTKWVKREESILKEGIKDFRNNYPSTRVPEFNIFLKEMGEKLSRTPMAIRQRMSLLERASNKKQLKRKKPSPSSKSKTVRKSKETPSEKEKGVSPMEGSGTDKSNRLASAASDGTDGFKPGRRKNQKIWTDYLKWKTKMGGKESVLSDFVATVYEKYSYSEDKMHRRINSLLAEQKAFELAKKKRSVQQSETVSDEGETYIFKRIKVVDLT